MFAFFLQYTLDLIICSTRNITRLFDDCYVITSEHLEYTRT